MLFAGAARRDAENQRAPNGVKYRMPYQVDDAIFVI
jgi:hypothetical protein